MDLGPTSGAVCRLLKKKNKKKRMTKSLFSPISRPDTNRPFQRHSNNCELYLPNVRLLFRYHFTKLTHDQGGANLRMDACT